MIRIEKVEHHIRIKTHKPIALRFWVESGVSVLFGWAHVSLVLYLPSDTQCWSGKACPVKKNGGTEKGSFRGSVPMWLKGLTLEREIVRNPSVSLSPTLTRIKKVEHHISKPCFDQGKDYKTFWHFTPFLHKSVQTCEERKRWTAHLVFHVFLFLSFHLFFGVRKSLYESKQIIKMNNTNFII